MTYKLVQVAGNRSLELSAERPVTVGRSITCDLVVDDPTLSRVHAEVSPVEGGLMVKDMGSRNGTFLNDSRIGMAMVMPGDVIGFGGVRFSVTEITETAETVEPEPDLPPPEQIPEPEIPPGRIAADELPVSDIPPPPAEPTPPAAERSPPPDEFQVTSARPLSTDDPLAMIADVEKLRRLLNLSKDLHAADSREALLEKVAAQVFECLDIDRIGLRFNTADAAKTPVQLSRSAVAGPEGTVDIPKTLVEKAISERAAIVASKADERSGSMHSVSCVPLIDRGGNTLGVLYVDNLAAPSAFDEHEIDFLIALADVTATAVENFRR